MKEFVRSDNPHKALKIGSYAPIKVGDRFKVLMDLYWHTDKIKYYTEPSKKSEKTSYDLVKGQIFKIDEIDNQAGNYWGELEKANTTEFNIKGVPFSFDMNLPFDIDWFEKHKGNYFQRI